MLNWKELAKIAVMLVVVYIIAVKVAGPMYDKTFPATV